GIAGRGVRDLGVQLVEERSRAGRPHRVGAVAVDRARLHRDANALVRRHVGAQAAEIAAPTGAVRRRGVVRTAGGELRAALHADRVLVGQRHRLTARLRAEVRAIQLAGGEAGHRLAVAVGAAQRIARGRVAGEDAGLEGILVDGTGKREYRKSTLQE